MGGKRALLAGAAAVVALLLVATFHQTGRVSLLDDEAASIKAVGDLGCLGSDCQMTDAGSRHDMDRFFDKFLGKGSSHAGHKSRFTPVHNKKVNTVEGVKEMQDFYTNLPGSKTKKVADYEKNSKPNPQLKTDDARDDMNKFYESLSHGKRANIIKSEKRAEKSADKKRAHFDTVAAKEDERMRQMHKANENKAREDHRRFKAKAQQQLVVQAAGHDMQAVPSQPRTDASERRAENSYFHRLQRQAKAQKAKNAERHSDEKSAHPVVTGKLSAAKAQEDMDKWYKQLNTKVHKTARILVAEEEARKDKLKLHSEIPSEDKEAEAAAKSAPAAVPTFKTSHSARLAQQDMDSYYAQLNAQVHKKQKIVKAEQKAEASYNTIKSQVALAHQESQKAAESAKPAVATTHHTVSAASARDQLNGYFASLDKQAKKTGIVLATEQKAEAEASKIKGEAREQDVKAEQAARQAPAAVGDDALSGQEARQQLLGDNKAKRARLTKTVQRGIKLAHSPAHPSATNPHHKAAWMKDLKAKALEAKGVKGTAKGLAAEWQKLKGGIVNAFVSNRLSA